MAYSAVRSMQPISAPLQRWVFLVDVDQLDQTFDAEVSERHHDVSAEPTDPDRAIFGFHFTGDIVEEVFVLAEIGRDLFDRRDLERI